MIINVSFKLKMKIKQTLRSSRVWHLFFLSIFSFTALSLALSVNVFAACDADDDDLHIDDQNGCLYKSTDEIRNGGVTDMTSDKLQGIINNCRNEDISFERDLAGGINDTACANAAVSCFTIALDKSKCDSKTLADIAFECGNGVSAAEQGEVNAWDGNDRYQGDWANGNCDPLAKANYDTLKAVENGITDKCKEATNDAASKSECARVTNEARNECANAAKIDSNGTGVADLSTWAGSTDGTNYFYNQKFPGGTDAYATCLNNKTREKTNDPALCGATGGIWVEKDYNDPVAGSNSNVTKGCKNRATDLINKDACEGVNKGYQWKQTGGADTSKPQDDAYGCVDPNADEPCKDRGGGQPDAEGKCPDGTKADEGAAPSGSLAPVEDRCGQARVNLLACGEDEGAAAFNNILKIILQVLTVLIGIAAVGGLAFAAVTYARAEDNASVTGEAKALIRNIVIGILLYGFLIAIVSWLLPGVSIV